MNNLTLDEAHFSVLVLTKGTLTSCPARFIAAAAAAARTSSEVEVEGCDVVGWAETVWGLEGVGAEDDGDDFGGCIEGGSRREMPVLVDVLPPVEDDATALG